MKKIVTNSMRGTFLDCPYKFFLEYIRRLTPIREADYFRWGRLVHKGLEQIDRELPVEDAISAFRTKTVAACPPPDIIVQTDRMCELLPSVTTAYELKWFFDNQNYETLGGEDFGGKFSMELPCGWLFQGKIDKIIRDRRDGSILTLERKTPKNVDDAYFEDTLLDSQPKGYLLACQRCLGFQATKALYDIIQKPGYRLKKGQTEEQLQQEIAQAYMLERDKYFHRRRMPFEQEEIDAYFWEIDQVAQMMEWHIREGIYPKHHPKNRIGGCAYRPICLNGDESKFYVRPLDAYTPELV